MIFFEIIALVGIVNVLTRSYLLQAVRDEIPWQKAKYAANCPQCTGVWVGAIYYLGRGLPSSELEEAITDAVTVAYVEYDSAYGASFATYAGLRVHWEVSSRFAHHKRYHVASEIDAAYDEDEGGILGRVEQPTIQADSAVFAKIASSKEDFIRALIDRALPEVTIEGKHDPRKNRKRDILIARYCDGLSWDAVADRLGLRSRSAAQVHDRTAKKSLQVFLQTIPGKELVQEWFGSASLEILPFAA